MKRILTSAILLAAISAAPAAQQVLDRSKIPPPAAIPQLRVPAWTKSALPNGAQFVVAEKHDLPLVSFAITFMGGTNDDHLVYGATATASGARLSAYLGSGVDTFQLDADTLGSGYVDFGPGDDVYTQGVAAVSFPLTLLNF